MEIYVIENSVSNVTPFATVIFPKCCFMGTEIRLHFYVPDIASQTGVFNNAQSFLQKRLKLFLLKTFCFGKDYRIETHDSLEM